MRLIERVLRKIARVAPGWLATLVLYWLCWATLAPVVGDARKVTLQPLHTCPARMAIHAVKCPPPHTVTTRAVTCLHLKEYDLCSL